MRARLSQVTGSGGDGALRQGGARRAARARAEVRGDGGLGEGALGVEGAGGGSQ